MTQQARVGRGRTSRRGLASDTLMILAGALLSILVARVTVPDAAIAPVPSGNPGESANVIGQRSQPPNPTLPEIATIGPAVNPSSGLNATPTPIPIITLGPPTPSPSDTIEPSPSGSTKPKGSFGPPPTVKPTLPPKPSAAFSCQLVALDVTCTVTNPANATAWAWDWGDGGGSSGNPGVHTYTQDGCFTATLTATGPGGVSSTSQILAVSAVPPGPTC